MAGDQGTSPTSVALSRDVSMFGSQGQEDPYIEIGDWSLLEFPRRLPERQFRYIAGLLRT